MRGWQKLDSATPNASSGTRVPPTASDSRTAGSREPFPPYDILTRYSIMPHYESDSGDCDCDRDREPVIHSVDPVIGPVGGGDATHLTTLRGDHLAGVRRVKFGRAKVRRPFRTQTDSTIVLEAPTALATVPTGVAPDFPLGVAVTARTRRHKSKPLTYTYSASSGDTFLQYSIVGGCFGLSSVTLNFVDPQTGDTRSPSVTYTVFPIPLPGTSGMFDSGPPGDPTLIRIVLITKSGGGEDISRQQCFFPSGSAPILFRLVAGSGPSICLVNPDTSTGVREVRPCLT